MKRLWKNYFFLYSLVYIFLRVFSFFFTPATPLWTAHILNSVISAAILLVVLHLLDKKDDRAWLIIAGEIILGGGGGYLAINGISLRLVLLIAAGLMVFRQVIKEKSLKYFTQNKYFGWILALGVIASLGLILGIYLGNNWHAAITDLIPYLFLFYAFPLSKLWPKENFRQHIFKMLAVAIMGSLTLTLLTFFAFSFEIFTLQDTYYHWFRDVALGKITEINPHVFRVVLNEHLLLIPVLLYFWYKNIKNSRKIYIYLIIALLIILSINITRAYLLALPIGLIFLINKHNLKKWLGYAAAGALIFLVSFTTLHLIASRFTSPGWEFFGLRIKSITQPTIEDSSLSRMLILPIAWEKINERPILGHGLGDEITVYSPSLKKTITTTHYDWGWLEIWAELGIVGLMVWLGFLINLFMKNRGNIFLPGIIALLVINITSPALFHVFGLIWIVVLLSTTTHPVILNGAERNEGSS